MTFKSYLLYYQLEERIDFFLGLLFYLERLIKWLSVFRAKMKGVEKMERWNVLVVIFKKE